MKLQDSDRRKTSERRAQHFGRNGTQDRRSLDLNIDAQLLLDIQNAHSLWRTKHTEELP